MQEYIKFMIEPNNLLITLGLFFLLTLIQSVLTFPFRKVKSIKKSRANKKGKRNIKKTKSKVLKSLGLSRDYLMYPGDNIDTTKVKNNMDDSSIESSSTERRLVNGFILTISNRSKYVLEEIGIASEYSNDFEYNFLPEELYENEEIDIEANPRITSKICDIDLVFDDVAYTVRSVDTSIITELRIYYDNIEQDIIVKQVQGMR